MKKLTRILAIVLSLAMVFVLASCDSLKGTDETTVTTALAGTVPIDKGAIKVGVLHITSIEDTSGYTFAHHSGVMEMKETLGLNDDQVIEKDNVSDTDIPQPKTAIQELIDAGCNIIFARVSTT